MVKEGKLPFTYDKSKARVVSPFTRTSFLQSKPPRTLRSKRTRSPPYAHDETLFPQGARFGLIKRGAEDKEPIRWFDAKGCSVFHTVNAWEEARDLTARAH